MSKLLDINNRPIKIALKQSDYPIKSVSRSDLQGEIGQILIEHFPSEPILEDFIIPGSRLSVDFFLPRRLLVIEVDGEQHDHFVPFFHGNKATSHKFAKQVNRDVLKEQWCLNNNIKIIRVNKESNLEEFRNNINGSKI